MNVSLIVLLLISSTLSVNAQYDIYLKALLKEPKIVPEKLQGEFVSKRAFDREYYEFSDVDLQIIYYPPDQDCGQFNIAGKQFLLKGRYNEREKFGCNLDGQSLEAFNISVADRDYILITSIALTSGKGTRVVFSHLFDVTDKTNVVLYSLWSLYGSYLSFGDYNDDGKLDFLETRYEPGGNDDDTFRVVFKTLNDHGVFEIVEGKYIIFHRQFDEGEPKISIVERHW